MTDPLALPHLAKVFRALRDGRHLCIEDGPLFTALEEHEDAFRTLFQALGYKLGYHRKGVYFFLGDSAITDTARRFCVFTFILVEHLTDRGDGIEEALFTHPFRLEELPHLQSDRYVETMAQVGVSEPDDLVRLLSSMERFGFAAADGETVRFRRPLFRIVDLCTQVLDEEEVS